MVAHLMYTGLSEYEARVYMAFLKKNPATAYEAAKLSGVPTSKVYETVARLEQKGILTAFDDEDARTSRYVPQPPEEYVHTSRQMMDRTLEHLGRDFEALKTDSPVSFIWNVNSYDALMDRVRRMILKAEGTLLMSLWKDEADLIAGFIGDAVVKGVRSACVHYGQPDMTAGQVFKHPIGQTHYDEDGRRSLVVVVDSKEALMGTVKQDGSAEGAYSTSRGFVDLAEDYVKHDIYMMKIVTRFDPFLKERFGPRYEYMRDVFSDSETL